jgi:hypothetical protein
LVQSGIRDVGFAPFIAGVQEVQKYRDGSPFRYFFMPIAESFA